MNLLQIIKSQVVVDGELEMHNLNVENWPNAVTSFEDSEDDPDPLDLENFGFMEISDDKIIMWAGGDWQEPRKFTIELVDGKPTVTSDSDLGDNYEEMDYQSAIDKFLS